MRLGAPADGIAAAFPFFDTLLDAVDVRGTQ
jgi:hypothetical protein